MLIQRLLSGASLDYAPPSLCFSDNGAGSDGGGGSSFTPEEKSAFEQMQQDDGADRDLNQEADPPDQGQEAPPEEDQPEGGEQKADQRQRMVPHAALHEERLLRRKAEQEATQQRQEWERRFGMLLERMPQGQQQAPQQDQQQPPPLPDPEKDLAGFLIEGQNRLRTELRQLVQHVMTERQQQYQQSQQQQLVSHVQTAAQMAEAKFSREHPDYTDAANYLAETRHKELELSGHRDPAHRLQIIQQEALGLAYSALQNDRDPAEAVYEMSILRGFKPPEQQSGPTPGQKLQQIANGQEQSRTTGNMRGGAPRFLSVETVMKMQGKDFDKFMEKATPEQLAAVYGD